MDSQCSSLFILRQGEQRKKEVKIVWFGFGVSERGSKLKATLHGAQLMVDKCTAISTYSTMVTLSQVHYEIHDEVSKNDKVHNSFIK